MEGFDTAFIDNVVRDLNKVDPGSLGFRYNGKVFDDGDPGGDELRINFEAILEQSQHVFNVLHSIKVCLIETYGMNADWQADMNSF